MNEIKVAIYKNIGIDVYEDMTYLAYVILSNGNYWGVRFNGATEEIARNKAIALWDKEQEKWKALGSRAVEFVNNISSDPWSDNGKIGPHNNQFIEGGRNLLLDIKKQHHFVWMRHKETRELKRVPLTEITMYEKNGFERSGPRSK